MATTIVTKSGSGAPTASDLVAGELAVDLTNGRLYTEDSGGTVLELGLNPSGNVDVTGTVTADGLTVDGQGTITKAVDDQLTLAYNAANSTSYGYYSIVNNNIGNEFSIHTGGSKSLNLDANGDISFYEDTGTTPKFFWDASAESLGIGTDAPPNTLSIRKKITGLEDIVSIIGNSAGQDVMGAIAYSQTDDTLIIRNDQVFATGGIGFRAGGTDNHMFIKTGGNVGIGTSSPFFTAAGRTSLSVNGTSSSILAFGKGGSSENYILADAGGLTIANTSATLPTTFFNNASSSMTIDASGNVGIGTSSPTGVSGYTSLDINNATSGALIDLSQGDAMKGRLIATASTMAIETASSVPILFQPAGTEAMRIDANGNLLLNETSVSGNAEKLRITSGGTSSATAAALFNNSAGTELFFVRSDGAFRTGSAAVSPYNNTAAVTANCFINTDGTLLRATSSRRYKKDISDARFGLSDLLNLRPVNYKGINSEVDEDTIYGGLIAEEVHEAGLTEFVEYNKENQPDALRYQHMVSLCIKAIQEQQATIESLEARVAALES